MKSPYLRTPWTNENALGGYVYILPRQYLVPEPEAEIWFQALLPGGKALIDIGAGNLFSFLEEHRDRPFVTYDALAFHQICLAAATDSRQRSMIWRRPAKFLLWDLRQLEKRIRYACTGQTEGDKDLADLFQDYTNAKQETLDCRKQVAHLEKILTRQLDRAIRELPLFRTLIDPTDEAAFSERVSNLDYYRAISAVENQSIRSQNAEADHYQYGSRKPHPSENPDKTYEIFHRRQVERRRHIILSAPAGPLGIGLDLQARLLADRLNDPGIVPDRSRIDNVAQSLFDRESLKLGSRENARCFKWSEKDGEQVLKTDKSGHVRKDEKNLTERLEQEVNKIVRTPGMPLDMPRRNDGSLSLKYADWLPFREFSDFIRAWTSVEAAAVTLKKIDAPFQDYAPFPRLRSGPAEVFAAMTEESFARPERDAQFIEIRLNDLFLRSALAANVAAYGIFPEMREVDYHDEARFPRNLLDYLVRHIDQLTSCKDEGGFKAWRSLPDGEKRAVVRSLVLGAVYQETIETTARRLQGLSVMLPPTEIDELRSATWELLVRCQPFHKRDRAEPKLKDYASPGSKVVKYSLSCDTLDSHKNALGISQILFEVTVNHFSGLTGVPRSAMAERFRNEVRASGNDGPLWSIVSRLERIKQDILTQLIIAYGLAFQGRCPYASKKPDESWYRTNPVSCLGRIGAPIHYADVISADIELFYEDVSMLIAFGLLAEGYDVVFLSTETLVIRADSVPAQVEAVARQMAVKILQNASVPESGFAEWLAGGLCVAKTAEQ